MMNELYKWGYFPEMLRNIMIENSLTPARLANNSGLQLKTIQAWLIGEQIPKPSSIWQLSKAMGRYEEGLFFSAVVFYHFKMQEKYDKEIRFEKSVSDYLNVGNWWQKLNKQEENQFLKTWKSILIEFESYSKKNEKVTATSNLILLPKPKILVLDEWDEIITNITKDSSILYSIPWKKFEDLTAHILAKYGWEITPMGYTKDDGIDIIAIRRIAPDIKFSMMVQCKRLSQERKVGVEIVREVWSVKWEKGFHQAMIATTSSFTRGAIEKGEKWDLSLHDHDSITNWCKDVVSPIHKCIMR